jgi:hypothetical protein
MGTSDDSRYNRDVRFESTSSLAATPMPLARAAMPVLVALMGFVPSAASASPAGTDAAQTSLFGTRIADGNIVGLTLTN